MAKNKFAASGSALANIAGGFGAGTRMIPRCACHPSRGSLGDNVASYSNLTFIDKQAFVLYSLCVQVRNAADIYACGSWFF